MAVVKLMCKCWSVSPLSMMNQVWNFWSVYLRNKLCNWSAKIFWVSSFWYIYRAWEILYYSDLFFTSFFIKDIEWWWLSIAFYYYYCLIFPDFKEIWYGMHISKILCGEKLGERIFIYLLRKNNPCDNSIELSWFMSLKFSN